MPLLVAVTLYPTDEACEKLAQLTNKPTEYSRERLRVLIKQYIPSAQKIRGQYYLTETELYWLASNIRVQKRPPEK